ncbi:MAG TPA: hypothetical protein VGI60_13955 [Chthoniobacterales bacterium]
MMRGSGSTESAATGNRDLFFACGHCGIPLVVDCAAAGAILRCEGCGRPVTVPQESTDPAEAAAFKVAEKLAELCRHLKENESQRTEVKGYINQLTIQLHRWQLRLQSLEERNKVLTTEIGGLRAGGTQIL